MVPVIAFLIAAVVLMTLVTVVVIARGNSRRQDDQWRAAAERLRLTYRPGRFLSRSEIYGPLADLVITIDVTTASGSSESTVTRYRVRYPGLASDMHLSRRTALTWAAEMFGESDLRTGDSEFDNAFAVRTSDPQGLSAVLTANARRVLLDLVRDFPSTTITHEQVGVERRGIDRQAATLVETTHRLVEVAHILQGRSPRPFPPELGPDPGVGESSLSPPPQVRRQSSKPPPRLEPPVSASPAGKEAMPDESAPRPPAPAFSGIGASEVARELFATRGLSFEIGEAFAKEYRGTKIDWPGEVSDVRTGVRPEEPTRVTVRVASVEHDLFGVIDVHVVASITGREPPRVSEREPVRLTGTLTDIDVMGRRLFVEEAVIEALPRS